MLKDNVLMYASGGGVASTTLLQIANNNPTQLTSIVGFLTLLLQLFISMRQNRIEKKRATVEVKKELESEYQELKAQRKELLEQINQIRNDTKNISNN